MKVSLTIDHQETLLGWAASRMGYALPEDSKAIAVVDQDGAILAVAWLNHFHDQGAWAHIAAEEGVRWANRRTLASIFYMPFEFFGLERITARVAADNRRSQNLARGLGFTLEGRERQALNGQDVLIFGMLADECRWLAKE